MKRLIAFSSVAHMGFVMLGIATLTDFGLNAAVFGMVAHGLITGMLFFVAGSVKERFHTLEIKRLGGLLLQAPKLGWILGFCAMASLGLPGLAGFWGEFPAILSAYNPAPGCSEELFRTYMVIAAIGTVLAAGYLLWLFQRTAFGTPDARSSPTSTSTTCTSPSGWPGLPMLVLIVVLGFFPNIIFHVTDPAVTAMGHTFAGVGGSRRARVARSSRQLDASTARRRLPRARARDRPHRRASCVVLLVDLFTPEGSRGDRAAARRHRPPRRPGPGAHPGRRRRRPRDVRRRLRRRQLRAGAQGLFLLSGYIVVLLSTNYIAEGDYCGGRVLLPAAVARCSA